MVFGFMNGGVWFCRMPGITVGKWTRKWTLTGKNCCRKRWVALWVFSSSLWCLPWSYMRHPFWCYSHNIFLQATQRKKWIFLKESSSFIPFFGLPFFLEGVKRGQARFFSFNLILVRLKKGKRWSDWPLRILLLILQFKHC
jgi:hypothetical protein